MRFGIDCRTIYQVKKNQGAGIERFVFFIVQNLLRLDRNNHYILFVSKDLDQETLNALKQDNTTIKKVNNALPFLSRHLCFALQLYLARLDLCLFPANVIPLFYFGRSLVTIHDLAIYQHPEWFEDRQWLSTKIIVPFSLKKAGHIVTISQTTKHDLLNLFPFVSPKKISVITQGINSAKKYQSGHHLQALAEFNLKKPFLLFLGTIEPRKNLIRLFRAFEKYKTHSDSTIELVVAGASGWKNREIFNEIKKINNRFDDQVIKYLGLVSDAQKAVLMHECQTFIFPSLYEGFGLPVFEAMSYGAPVIASTIPSFNEIIKDEAILIDPKNKLALKSAIKKILEDQELRKKLSLKGRELAKRFTWQKTAQAYLSCLADLCR